MLDDNVHTDIPSCQFTYALITAALVGREAKKKGFVYKFVSIYVRTGATRDAHFVAFHLSPFLPHPFIPIISVFLSRGRNRGFSSHKSFIGAVKGKHVQSAPLNSHSLLFISI